MQVLKEISFMEQNPASQPVTNATASSFQAQVAQKAAVSTSGTLQSAATANGNGSTISTDGMSSAVVTVNCSSCSGGTTVNFEGTEDGSNYSPITATQLGSTTLATTTSTSGLTYWQIPVAGLQNIRARISGYSAGTITVTAHAVPVDWNSRVMNANIVANTATNQSTNVAQVAGTTTDTNSGNKSAGTQRIVIATDQPALTNAQPVKEAAGDNVTLGNTTDTAAADANGTVNAHVREVAKDTASIVANGTKLTNGTQAADTVAGDSGQNSLVTSGARKEVTYSTTSAAPSTAWDVSNYRWVEVQITSAGTNATHTFQVSNDNSTWLSFPLVRDSSGGSFHSFTTNPTSTGLFYGPINARYFRVNITGITAGTAAATLEFLANPGSVINFPVKLLGDSGNVIVQSTSATSAPNQGIATLGVYNSTELSPTNTQSTALQIDSKGRLKMTLRDAAGNDRGVNINSSNEMNVSPGATENYLGFVGGKATIVSANFTRPADTTAYASGDLIANSTTAGSVTPMSFTASRINDASGMVRRAKLKKSTTSTTNASYRLHLYQNDPSASSGITNGDNGAWSTKEANYLGSLTCDMTATTGRAFSDAASAQCSVDNGTEINFIPKSGTQLIYGLLEARGAYTPGNAEVFTVYLEVLQN
jgi:hypothetical protein